jgi:hypothetical protein
VEEVHKESVEDAATHATDEARMVLPGVQAILGFQLIAVFNQKFDQLPAKLQIVHLLAFALIALAMGLLMAPAAYQRTVETGFVTRHFVFLASALLTLAMLPLMLGLALDTLIISYMVTQNAPASGAFALGIFLLLGCLWYLLPCLDRARRRRRH